MRFLQSYTSFLIFISTIQTTDAVIFTSKDGIEISYELKFENFQRCHSENGRVSVFSFVSIDECIQQCGLREHCGALNYRFRSICELFLSPEEGVLDKGRCIHINGSDIKVTEKPCSECIFGQTCEVSSKTCLYKECLTAPVPENGRVLGNINNIGGKILYKCNHGYTEKNGITTAVCLHNGQWSDMAYCVKDCGYPPSIDNGNVMLDTVNGNSYMDTASVTCNAGYVRSVDKIECKESGNWETATCGPINCGNPPSIDNGNVVLDTVNGNSYLDTASVTCNAGYVKNVDKIDCTESGNWETATCGPINCGNPPSIDNGNVVLDTVNGNSYLDTASVTCNAGYVKSVDKIDCTESGNWETATCGPINCGNPPSIDNGNVVLDTVNGNSYLDTASVTCNAGYVKSVDKIDCTESGNWETATCGPINCGNPPSIDNGNVVLDTINGNSYLDTASVTCNAGYVKSVDKIDCTESGNWETATCGPIIACGELPSIPDGTAVLDIGESNTYLGTATVTCDLWYQTRNNIIQCTDTGDWETVICADCYLTTTQKYNGKRNQTSNGKPCMNWADMSDHEFHDFLLLPDSSVSEAKNYCRNPHTTDWKPWCYTNYEHLWGYCGIDSCV